MATYYIDFEGGNDANDGLSFANRWKTFTNGATAARIAPGDTMRVMASPNPTSIGNATWTNGPRGTNVAIASSTNATPIVITTSTAHGLVAGDYVTIIGHNTNTNANGVWQVGTVGSGTTFQILQIGGANTTGNGGGGATGNASKATNCMVKLSSAVTQNIALFGGLAQKPAWTASASVTTSVETGSYKEGYGSQRIAIAAGFTTGKAAYYTLPSTLDLSGYQQVSFWINQPTGAFGATGACYIALCSDTLGATVVNTINIPLLYSTSTWQPVTVDLGANLGSSIQSVAFYVVTDNGAQTFLIDNIIACKASSSADSLNLASLISKSDGTGNEAWYATQSINQDVVMLANSNGILSTSNNVRGYMGTTETVTTYKRETIKTTPVITANVIVNVMQESGDANNIMTYSGGWNRTDMSTQTGETWYDGQNGNGYGFVGAANVGFVRTDKLNGVRYNQGWRVVPSSNYGGQIGSGRFTACSTGIITSGSTGNNFDSIWANNNGTSAITLGGTLGTVIGTIYNISNTSNTAMTANEQLCNLGTIIQAHNNVGSGVSIGGNNITINSLTSNSNTQFGVNLGTARGTIIGGGSTTGNGTSAFNYSSGTLFLNNFTINEATEFSGLTSLGSFFGPAIFANRLDDTDNNNWVFAYNGTVNQQTAIVDSPATTAWKLSPTQAITSNAATPVQLKLGTVVCAASSLVTVTARMLRDNTGLTMRLECPGGQISGVPSDVFTDMTAAANTWETVTITFTPTKAGAVDIYAYAFGGTTFSGYVCNLTASQA